jgi:hypothetical protein
MSQKFVSKRETFVAIRPAYFFYRHLGPKVYKSETLNCVFHVKEFWAKKKNWSGGGHDQVAGASYFFSDR